jgi:hypothetical protein
MLICFIIEYRIINSVIKLCALFAAIKNSSARVTAILLHIMSRTGYLPQVADQCQSQVIVILLYWYRLLFSLAFSSDHRTQ